MSQSRTANAERSKKVDKKREENKRNFKKGLTRGEVCDIIMNANRKGASLLVLPAGVAEQADARDLKSRDTKVSYRFDPGHRHQGMQRRDRTTTAKTNIAE